MNNYSEMPCYTKGAWYRFPNGEVAEYLGYDIIEEVMKFKNISTGIEFSEDIDNAYNEDGTIEFELACCKSIAELFKPSQKPTSNTVNTVNTGNHDSVQKPKHYMLIPDQGIEVRDVCKAMSEKISSKGYSAMLVSDYVQMLQYLLRWQDKNGLEDLEKAEWYLKQIIKSLK